MPNDPPHTETDWQEIKELSRKLLANLKSSGNLVDNWYNKPDMNAGVRMIIREVLEHLPASYSPALYDQKCEETYRHIRTYYRSPGGGNGPMSA
jgi:type I restriction enzyme R subunit